METNPYDITWVMQLEVHVALNPLSVWVSLLGLEFCSVLVAQNLLMVLLQDSHNNWKDHVNICIMFILLS